MKFKHLALATILLRSSFTLAQGSGSTSTNDFKMTRSMEGKIVEIKADDSLVVIEDKQGERHSLLFTTETKIAAAKSGDGGPALKLAELKAGQKVKAVFRSSDSHAVTLKLLN